MWLIDLSNNGLVTYIRIADCFIRVSQSFDEFVQSAAVKVSL